MQRPKKSRRKIEKNKSEANDRKKRSGRKIKWTKGEEEGGKAKK